MLGSVTRPLTRARSLAALLLTLGLGLGLAGCGGNAAKAHAPVTGARAPLPPGHVAYGEFRSRAIAGTDHFAVYLPHDYATTNRRYPVIYFLHGLPDDGDGYRSGRISQLGAAVERSGVPAMIVAPQGARRGDTDPEWHDFGSGRNWETATAVELVDYVDRHYRTIRGRGGRALVGLSAGGYGATLIAVHHPGTFSVIQSWSGYFHPTDPAGSKPLDLGSMQANDRASLHAYVGELRRVYAHDQPTFFAFYVGDHDPHFADENEQLHRELVAAEIPHVYQLYSGAHTGEFWSQHEDVWIRGAVLHLLPATYAR